MVVGGIAPTSDGNAVILMDGAARRGLVLSIGGAEAPPAALKLGQHKLERPLMHNLLDSVIRKMGGDVAGVRIDRVQGGIYFGSVLINKSGQIVEVDARPSEAMTLAIGDNLPVFVAEGVLARAGIEVDKFDFRKLHETPAVTNLRTRPGEVEL